MTLNLLAAVPPTVEVGAALPIGGPLGLAGSLAMLVLSGVVIWLLVSELASPDGPVGEYDRAISTPERARPSSAGP
jgi:hypothetical protein